MSEIATPSVWEDLIHHQRWEDLRERLTATHSSDIADAMGQIHGKEQAVVKLGVARSTLESKIRSLKIDKNRFRPPVLVPES